MKIEKLKTLVIDNKWHLFRKRDSELRLAIKVNFQELSYELYEIRYNVISIKRFGNTINIISDFDYQFFKINNTLLWNKIADLEKEDFSLQRNSSTNEIDI